MEDLHMNTLNLITKWCEDNSTPFTSFDCGYLNGDIILSKYDGVGSPKILKTFTNDDDILRFLHTSSDETKALHTTHTSLLMQHIKNN